MKNRKPINTRLDRSLYQNIGAIALHPDINKDRNDLLEEGIQYILDNFEALFYDASGNIIKPAPSSDRKSVNTTLDTVLYKKLQYLAIDLGLNYNDIIEAAMRHIISKYKDVL